MLVGAERWGKAISILEELGYAVAEKMEKEREVSRRRAEMKMQMEWDLT